MTDHGGNLDMAMASFGGSADDWIDLSTGINRVPWPMPQPSLAAHTALPTAAAMRALTEAARHCYRADGTIIPLAGAQQAIQLLPRLLPSGIARVLSPTYNEHAKSLTAAGWQVETVTDFADLAGADLAVVVNPNNPDGRRFAPDALAALSREVGQLIIDESFGDICPDLSLAPKTGAEGLWVLRSFGKFFGLAGLRLGFAIGPEAGAAALADLAGPWPISGAAIEAGTAALADTAWHDATRKRLAEDANRLDAITPWRLVGGTDLFRLYDTPDAIAAQQHLARHRIWSRIFPWSKRLIRLGLPAPEEWDRLAEALRSAQAAG